MTELMRLYSTDLRSSSDTLLDLGASGYRWNNLYLRGSINNLQVLSATLIYASTINAAVVSLSSEISSPTINASSMNAEVGVFFTTVSSPVVTCNSLNSVVMKATVSGSAPILYSSSAITVVVKANSSIIMQMAGSTLALNNGTNTCINTPILVATPPVMASGNIWFFSSSNHMYLAVRSTNTTYYVLMAS